jgi:hypothetical protein
MVGCCSVKLEAFGVGSILGRRLGAENAFERLEDHSKDRRSLTHAKRRNALRGKHDERAPFSPL